MEDDPNPDRVKDPLGHYEELRAKAGPDTTWAGFIVFGYGAAALAGICVFAWGVVSLLSRLF